MPGFLKESAVQSALKTMELRIKNRLELRDPRETVAPKEIGEFLDHPAEMETLVSQDPLALLVLPALAETSLLKCMAVMTRNLLVSPCPALWVPWVPVVLLALLVHLVPKASKVPLVNPASLVHLVLLVPEVLQAHPARTVMMVKLANLDAPVSVVLLALRELVAFPELLAFQA